MNIPHKSKTSNELSLVATEAHNAISIFDNKGELIWVNKEFSKIYGFTLLGYINEFGNSIFRSDNNKNIIDKIKICIELYETVIYEKQTITDSGNSLWVQTTLTPVVDNDKLIQLIAIDIDISNIKAVEGKIKLHKDEIKKYSEDLLKQKKSQSKINIQLLETQEEIKQQADGLKEQSVLLQHSNNELTLQKESIQQTIEDLKLSQSKLVQTERMSALGQLTAGIAHEINNPLNYIKAGIDALKPLFDDLTEVIDLYFNNKDIDEGELFNVTEELKEDIEYEDLIKGIEDLSESIIIGAEKTAEIIEGLQTFSENNEAPKRLANIHKSIDSAILMLNNYHKNRIKIKKEYNDLIKEILCYPGQLNQVFVNIISNAIHAIPETGTITIKTQILEIDYENYIVVSISDTGIGMSKAVKKRIFEPFYTKKDVGKGTGLGLSISFNIIKKHNGKIKALSEKGKGSEFQIYLPVE